MTLLEKLAGVTLAFVVATPVAFAQSAASNKAFYVSDDRSGLNVVTYNSATIDGPGDTILHIPSALKTSTNGGISANVSMECALWTYNTVTATNGAGKNSSSSRAGLYAWVEVNGVAATPGEVVFCDRAQAVGLAVDLTCTTSTAGETCTVNGDVTLDLFQATKNANSFTFFSGPLAPILHDVKVKAKALVECWSSTTGTWITCPSGTVANYTNAGTKALIGKVSLLVEEHNNYNRVPK